MEFKADEEFRRRAFFYTSIPVIMASVFLLIDIIDYQLGMGTVIFFIFCVYISVKLAHQVKCDFETHLFIHENRIILTFDYDDQKIHQLGWEHIDFIARLDHSIFHIPGIFFVAKANYDFSILFSTYLLAYEDKMNLYTYIKELADQKSVPINFTVEVITET